MAKTPTVDYLDLFPKSTALVKAEPKKHGKVQIATDVIEGELVEKNEGMTLHKSIMDLLNGGSNPDGTKTVERLAFEVNPDLNAQTAGVYHVKPRLLPDEIIKRLLIQDDLIAAIVRVREHQVSAFGRPRPDRFDTGFVLELHADLKDSLTPEEKADLDKRIHAAVKLFETCGHNDGLRLVDRMSFSQWLHMSARHAVGLGRIATEIVGSGEPDSETGDKKFHHFRPLDVSTIYRATNQRTAQESVRRNALQQLKKILPPGAKIDEKDFAKGCYSWIQVIGGMARQAFTDTECLVHNFFPVADIELDHYPVTPIDTMITAITTHLNITKHNAMYFQTGRATRGMLVFESDDVDPQTLNTIKQQFNASINNVNNCLDGSTLILTKEAGGTTIDSYLGGAESKNATVWTPYGWQPGQVYKTGPKTLAETKVSNGIVLLTSPDHRIRTIDESGERVWKKQEDLKVGDFILVNATQVDAGNPAPKLFGKSIDADLMEVLGWMIGDGFLGERSVRLFYHHEREIGIRERHLQFLRNWGIDAVLVDETISEEERAQICARYGFKTCAATRTSIAVNDINVANGLISLGFTKSVRGAAADGKSVPAFIYTSSEELKSAFLMGLFSADGNNAKNRSPALTCCNHHLRGQVKTLLLSMGIRTSLSEGKSKNAWQGDERTTVAAPSVLRIKDRDVFFEKIGFLQAHKQPKPVKNDRRAAMQDRVPQALALKYIRIVKDKTKLPRGGKNNPEGVFTRREQMDLDEVLRGERAVSKGRLKRIASKAEIELPVWIDETHFEQVVEVASTGRVVDMFDVAVYEPTHDCSGHICKAPQHAFFANMLHTANSWRMPVFSVGTNDSLTWTPIDNSSRDAEFQYLNDQNARIIFSAFQISPDEVPGWSYLSRGTNNQGLSESNTEYKLEAARDVGIRPLLQNFEDFINASIFPLIDPILATKCRFKLKGLDAETEEKESVRLQQDAPLHLTIDQVLEAVEKKPIGKRYAGEFLLNPQWQSIVDKYLMVGDIMEHFFGIEGAAKDPKFQYMRDPFWFQNVQLQQQQAQLDQQAQMQQQQAASGQPPGGGPPQGDSDSTPPADASGGDQSQPPAQDQGSDLSRSVDQAIEVLTKGESDLPMSKQKLLAQHRLTLSRFRRGLEDDIKEATKEILDIAEKHATKK